MERVTDQVSSQEICPALDEQSSSNAFVPVCCLPAEILSQIFVIVTKFPQPGYSIGPRRDCRRHWIKVTHVCRFWREVALDCAVLWTTLPLLSPAFTLGILGITKNAPLPTDFGHEFGIVPDMAIEMLKQIFSQPHRLRDVHLMYHPRQGLPVGKFLSECVASAPVLEKLVVLCQVRHKEGFPDNFLHGDAPSLKHMELYHCGARWNTIPFSATLRRLHLNENRYNSLSAVTRPPLPDFLAILRSMPVLEDLTLVGVLPARSLPESFSSTPRSAAQIALPALTYLDLKDFSCTILQFAQLVGLPQVNSIVLFFAEMEIAPTVVGGILQAMRATAKTDSVTPSLFEGSPSSLTIYGDDGSVLEEKSIEIKFEPRQSRRFTPETSLCLSFEPSETPVTDYLLELRHEVDFSSLLTLNIREDSDLLQFVWTSIFSSCTRLRKIKMYSSPCLRHLLRALGKGAVLPSAYLEDGNTTQDALPLFLPSLKTIQVECVDRSLMHEPDRKLLTKWVSPAELIQTIERRSRTLYPIEELVLKECPFFDPRDEELLQHIDHLTVIRDGGYELYDEDSSSDEDSE